jgi:integrase
MSIRKRGERYLVTVELGTDERGVRRRKHATYATEQEALREEAVLRAEVLTGVYVEPSVETLAEFLAEWLTHVSRNRRQRTRDAYRITVERHLVPALGRLKLAEIRPLHIERFITAQHDRGLAPATVAKHFWTLHKALDRAVAWGKLARNPADRVEKPGTSEAQVRTFDVAEQAKILGRAAGTWQYGPIMLGLATGMRRGEIVALRWRDVDLEGGVLAVRGSVEESSAGVELGATKTDAAVRRIRIPESIVAFLTDHRAKQRQLYRAVSAYRDRGLVFPSEDGSPKRPSTVTTGFARLCRTLEIGDAHFHCLRHTFATEMLRAGVPVKVVSEMLGHASVATTLRIYAHVLADMQEAAAVQAGRLIGRAVDLSEERHDSGVTSTRRG